MIIKKKSLIVALVSSFVIASVLVWTLIGYIIYLEFKDEESRRMYHGILEKLSARIYSRYIEVSKLNVAISSAGPLRGNPMIGGVIKNNGTRTITDILIKVKFLDQDNAIIYEVIFHPQEPSLGSAGLTRVAIPYLSTSSRAAMDPGGLLPFKKVLINCPKEILASLKKGPGFAKRPSRWAGKLGLEVLAIEF